MQCQCGSSEAVWFPDTKETKCRGCGRVTHKVEQLELPLESRQTAREYVGAINVGTHPILADPLELDVRMVMNMALALWKDRQAKYGPRNIAATGALGCYVRANDKLARLGRVYLEGKRTEMSDESINDSWLDLLNYALMGYMCENNLWPGSVPLNTSPGAECRPPLPRPTSSTSKAAKASTSDTPSS